jgi:hypothetical protein
MLWRKDPPVFPFSGSAKSDLAKNYLEGKKSYRDLAYMFNSKLIKELEECKLASNQDWHVKDQSKKYDEILETYNKVHNVAQDVYTPMSRVHQEIISVIKNMYGDNTQTSNIDLKKKIIDFIEKL